MYDKDFFLKKPNWNSFSKTDLSGLIIYVGNNLTAKGNSPGDAFVPLTILKEEAVKKTS